MLSQPSQIYCFPIYACSLCKESYWCLIASVVIHVVRVDMSCSQMCGAVFSNFSHSSNCCNDFSHNSHARGLGHSTMCGLSSWGSVHLGHCVEVQNFHLCIFFPVAKWPDMYLDTRHLQFGGTSCIALPIDSRSIFSDACWHILSFYPVSFCVLAVDVVPDVGTELLYNPLWTCVTDTLTPQDVEGCWSWCVASDFILGQVIRFYIQCHFLCKWSNGLGVLMTFYMTNST